MSTPLLQPSLFESLPETERARKPARRSRATTVAAPVAVDVVREDVPPPAPTVPPLTLALVPPPPVPMAPRADFDPAALTNAELRALVLALPDQKLAHLLVEAARELKRRAAPGAWDEDGAENGEDGPAEPNPLLLRAARQAVGELSGEDG